MFKHYWWMFLVMAVVCGMAGFMISAVVTYVMPRKYESSVVLEVKPRGRPIPQMGQDSDLQRLQAERMHVTVFQAMVSRECLVEVSQALELPKRWELDEEAVLAVLLKTITTENIRGTDLIRISVRHSDREIARDVAAGVVRSYVDYRVNLETGRLKKGIEELRDAISEQRAKVEQSRKRFADLEIMKPNAVGEEVDARALSEAKNELLREQEILAEMLKYGGDPAPIQTDDLYVIHEPAALADSPVSPNVPLDLVLGAVGGVLLSPMFALSVMWLMNRKLVAGS